MSLKAEQHHIPLQTLQVVDLSGYSFTGKSAVYDLLREFDGFYAHSKEFEFDIIRIQGGILDTKQALVHQWSPVRSSEAIRNLYRLIYLSGGTGTFWDRLTRTGSSYDRYFPGFTANTVEWTQNLIQAKWQCEWPFALFSKDILSLVINKVLRKFRLSRQDTVYLARMTNEQFDSYTRIYFNKLFAPIASQGFHTLVLNNAFEPFSPQNSITLFDQAKSIVVDRDPRDIYLSALRAGKIEGSLVGKAITGENINHFIERFRLYRTTEVITVPNVLRIQFEELVLNYDNSVNKIRKFLNQPNTIHSRKGTVFNPLQSIKNIGQWKTIQDPTLFNNIKKIQEELPGYCLKF